MEKNTVLSKNTIQLAHHYDQLREEDLLNLNHLNVSRFDIFDSPIKETEQIKRLVLFSDNPLDIQSS